MDMDKDNLPSSSTGRSIEEQLAEEMVKLQARRRYQDAVKLLNTLQARPQGGDVVKKQMMKIPETIKMLDVVSMSLEEIDNNLAIIHVTGTKGKGMTCAYTESILRSAGLKTGLFTSPHLTAVRERIRINGKPLSEDAFAKYCCALFSRLVQAKFQGQIEAPEMPGYFRFLTVLAFHVFLEEKVDVAVIEVGIGGKYDCTNIIRKPVVCGISSIGLDHQNVLGQSLEEITLQKAGIMKPGVPTYTVGSHPLHILDELEAHAKFVQCPLYVVHSLEPEKTSLKLGVDDGEVARLNASLAVHLANEFLLQKRPAVFPSGIPTNADVKHAIVLPYNDETEFLPFHIEGLQSTKWDGRFQILRHSENLTFFLDGAHTVDSLQVALKWFDRTSSPKSIRILLFNLTRNRPPLEFLDLLAKSGLFNMAIFCPFVAAEDVYPLDNWSAMDQGIDPMEACQRHAELWRTLHDGGSRAQAVVCPSAEKTLEHLQRIIQRNNELGKLDTLVNVMVTGSLHLVGTFLTILDPCRNNK